MAQKKKGRKPAAKKSAAKRKAASRGPAAKKKAAKQKPAKKGAAPKKPAPARTRSSPRGRGRAVSDPVAEIQRVIDVMVAAGAVEVELEEAGTKLRVRLKSDVPVSVVPYATAGTPAAVAPVVAAPGATAEGGAIVPPPAAIDDPKRTVFKSPMVGTFYRAPAPDADPYVEVGDRFGPDTTLCILEAMKVMNEIKAETSGEVVEILAQNGEPVEFGQPLFVIRID